MSRTARSGRTIRRTRTSFRNGRAHLVSSLASGELRCSTHVRPLVRSNKLDRSQLHRQQLHRLLHRNPFDPQPAAVCGADATLEVAPASAYLGGGAAAIWTHAGAMPILGPMRRRCRYLDVLVLGNPGGTLALPHTKLFIEIINLWGIRGPAAGTPALPIGARRRPAQPDLEFPRTTAPPPTVPEQPAEQLTRTPPPPPTVPATDFFQSRAPPAKVPRKTLAQRARTPSPSTLGKRSRRHFSICNMFRMRGAAAIVPRGFLFRRRCRCIPRGISAYPLGEHDGGILHRRLQNQQSRKLRRGHSSALPCGQQQTHLLQPSLRPVK